MARIAVKKISEIKGVINKDDSIKDLLCLFCYYYPQYTYMEALNMPLKTLKRHLKTVRREKARNYLELAQIARLSQEEKLKSFSDLINRYQREANNG